MADRRTAHLTMMCLVLASAAAAAAEPPAVNLDAGEATMVLPELAVVSQRLDQARSALEPSLGATRYDFSPGRAGDAAAG